MDFNALLSCKYVDFPFLVNLKVSILPDISHSQKTPPENMGRGIE